ncbi:hypothetical protein [Marinoscillum furvescens]|uniref:Uncharacterized protein n=1 Tax=Marinoscillum furvescens DSM 4134 TaxID=1122208 RepID=A0A3D9L0Y5_MARFU|nr:hypothetical protein [Marinoscillum furvescens]RED96189.1 hypothetical protein C7460_11580 [Marinoscillum furvescens DSM 4134]
MQNKFYILLFWLLVAWACDPCDDCGEPLVYDPKVKLVFINQDSAAHLEDSISRVTDSIDNNKLTLALLKDTSVFFADSLETIDSLVEAGETEYLDKQEALNHTIDSLDTSADSLSSWNRQLNTLKSDLNTIVKVISDGKVQLDEVILVEANKQVVFEDTLSSFGFPLLLADGPGVSSFEITLADEQYTIAFEYTTFEEMGADRILRVLATDVNVTNYTGFDSLKINCETCLSNETTVTVYF